MDWQSWLAGIIVVIAAVWLVRRVLRIVRSGSRDGAGHVSSCGMCDNNPDAAKSSPLVQLDSNRTPKSGRES